MHLYKSMCALGTGHVD